MPQLLLELLSEEIPARMQAQAARDLERIARERLTAAELPFDAMRAFAGPRRLTLVVDGLPLTQADRTEERKGPRTNAPDKALDGFLRSTGLTRDELSERDGVYYASLHRPGRSTAEIVAEMVEAIVRGFPWPKSMRWGAGTLRWVRPLKRILCILDGAVAPFAIDGIESGNVTEGHRFMGSSRAPFAVSGFEDYARKLGDHFVVLDAAERKVAILDRARELCAERGLELVEDEGLLDEVAGLVEWPVPILGDMDPGFLDLPAEVIRTSMRTHQRYFAVRDPETGRLAPHFVVVANIEPQDGGAVVAAGNARVLTARLSDARFFWDEDRRPGAIDRWLDKLNGVTFHAKLGTMAERVERIAALAVEIAPLVGADPKLAGIAARLCKADLASGMVGEFPELQGIMGGYYVRQAPYRDTPWVPVRELNKDGNEDPFVAPETQALSETDAGPAQWWAGLSRMEVDEIADAVRDHYKPVGPSDSVPTAPITVAVALADKLDTLVGFFAIDERPTGSRDPFALRRAALGGIRSIVRSGIRLPLTALLLQHHSSIYRRSSVSYRLLHRRNGAEYTYPVFWSDDYTFVDPEGDVHYSFESWVFLSEERIWLSPDPIFPGQAEGTLGRLNLLLDDQPNYLSYASANEATAALLTFFADRLKVLLRDEGKRHDLVDAVFAPVNGKADDDLVRIVRRVEALSSFLATEDGVSLLAGYKRASNILRIEEKKDGVSYAGRAERLAGAPADEAALIAAIDEITPRIDNALTEEDFGTAMTALSRLRRPVDDFFDRVLVNDPDPIVRRNRLMLLSQIRSAADRVADFSRIAG